jgi:hypothetical protein
MTLTPAILGLEPSPVFSAKGPELGLDKGRGFGEELSRAGLEFGRASFRPKKIMYAEA